MSAKAKPATTDEPRTTTPGSRPTSTGAGQDRRRAGGAVSSFAATVDRWVERVARSRRAGPGRRPAARPPSSACPPAVRDRLRGDWLGIPLHPMLTDVTIGAWTGSFVADLSVARRPGARARSRAADPARQPRGAADRRHRARRLERPRPRGPAGRASCTPRPTSTATLLYARSYGARDAATTAPAWRGAWSAATVATVGGHLGGVLVFRYSGGVRRARRAAARPPADPLRSRPRVCGSAEPTGKKGCRRVQHRPARTRGGLGPDAVDRHRAVVVDHGGARGRRLVPPARRSRPRTRSSAPCSSTTATRRRSTRRC